MNDKEAIILAIWRDPEKAFGCKFKQVRDSRQESVRVPGDTELNKQGRIILLLSSSGKSINVYYNGDERENDGVFDFLSNYRFNGASFKETLKALGEIYGVEVKFSAEELKKLSAQALAKVVAESLTESLRKDSEGEVAKYIRARGLEPDSHFGELTPESLKRLEGVLKLKGIANYSEELKTLHITEYWAKLGYSCMLPFYEDGKIIGFKARNIKDSLPGGDRWRDSNGLGKPVYCDRLERGIPAVIVEGQFDAIALTQAGVKNVVAFSGKGEPGEIMDSLLSTFKLHDIKEATYIPDVEFDSEGKRKTAIIYNAVNTLLSGKIDGERVIKNLYISDLPVSPAVSLKGYKIDAADYNRDNGREALAEAVKEAVAWWAFELDDLEREAKERAAQEGSVNIGWIQLKFNEIYTLCGNIYERERIKKYISGKALFAESGITPGALADIDGWRRGLEYKKQIREASEELNKAVEEQSSQAKISEIADRLNEALACDTRDEWSRQLGESFEDELSAIREQPETLKTKWRLGKNIKGKGIKAFGEIEFYPADIAVFCAPTSHGKTMILFQAAMDAIRSTNKTFLYVSCEENKRQLLERALNVYLDIETTPDGKTSKGDFCFIEQTRKKTIKAVIKGSIPPIEYAPFMGSSEHYNALSAQIRKGIEDYKRDIFPRLRFIHTDASAENICTNVRRFVEDARNEGTEIGGVFVDYMQLLSTDKKNFSRHDELKDICRELKECAADTELPVVIAAQLNRDVLKNDGGIDSVTLANIGEGADIERIAHDIYFVWQIDKTNIDSYATKGSTDEFFVLDKGKLRLRSTRIFTTTASKERDIELKRGYLYIEQLKARDGLTGTWALLPFIGERGYIGETDFNMMGE